MLKSSDYTIINQTYMMIHYDIDKPINFNLIDEKIQFTQVIFSNFPDVNKYFESDKLNLFHSMTYYEKSEFNNLVILRDNITFIAFGYEFDQPIELTNSLTHLIFGNDFDQSIRLTNSITHLTFDREFNQPIELVSSLIDLTFGFNFNQPIILTHLNNLTHLTFSARFNQPIELPDFLTHLTFNKGSFNKSIGLTNSLISLKFGDGFDKIIILKSLMENQNQKQDQFVSPVQLNYLAFGRDFNQPINHIIQHATFLTQLILGRNFNQPIQLTNSLTHLTLGNHFSHSIDLVNIKYLTIDCENFHVIDNLPNSLISLQFDSRFNLPLNNLPNSIEFIKLERHYLQPLNSIPSNLKRIDCHYGYNFTEQLKNYRQESNMNFQIYVYYFERGGQLNIREI